MPVLGGVGGQESFKDVFLTVTITQLIPSSEKGTSSHHNYTSCQGKENYLCPTYLFVSECVCVCAHVPSVNNSLTSVVVPVKHSCTGRRLSQVIAALTGH